MIVCVDPGHGGKDPGAIATDGDKEKDLVLRLAKEFRDVVMAGDYEYKVYLTRASDRYLTLQARCSIANTLPADLFVSFHCNSSENQNAEGVEVWYCSGSEEGKALAAELYLSLLGSMEGINGRGIKGDVESPGGRLYVLRHTAMPAALIEFEFLSNPQEYVEDDAARRRIVHGLAEAINLYFIMG